MRERDISIFLVIMSACFIDATLRARPASIYGGVFQILRKSRLRSGRAALPLNHLDRAMSQPEQARKASVRPSWDGDAAGSHLLRALLLGVPLGVALWALVFVGLLEWLT